MLCAYTRPGYQVSVYRTIAPLVTFLTKMILIDLRRSAANNWQISTSCFYFVE